MSLTSQEGKDDEKESGDTSAYSKDKLPENFSGVKGLVLSVHRFIIRKLPSFGKSVFFTTL
jgi:hypothetical protein